MTKMHAVPSNPTLDIEGNFTIAEAKATAILDLLRCVDRNGVIDELKKYTVSGAAMACEAAVEEMQAAFAAMTDLKGRASA